MTPRAEVRTLDAQGLKDFIQELKREKYRHEYPFERFLAMHAESRKRAPKAKRLPATADGYAQYIDQSVAGWEAQQAKAVEEAAVPKPPTSRYDMPLADAEMMSRGLKARFRGVAFYVGDLNRDVNEARVVEYGTAMEKGEWWFTPDPIVVTDTGEIINGQHRLLAVERAERPDDVPAPQFVVVWGVDKQAAILMDESRRSTTDRRDIAMRYARAAKG